MADVFHSHLLNSLCCESGPPSACAIKHKLFSLREQFTMIRAVWINPELEHSPGCMNRSGQFPFSLEFSNIPDVDDGDSVVIQQRCDFIDTYGLDIFFGFFYKRFVANFYDRILLILRLTGQMI